MKKSKKAPTEMSVASLRAAGKEFDVDALLKRYPKLRPRTVWWHRGDVGLRRKHTMDGCNIRIADCDGSEETVEQVAKFLENAGGRRLLKALVARGASIEIDISLEVGSKRYFVNSLTLTPRVMAAAARAGVELRVTGYPTR